MPQRKLFWAANVRTKSFAQRLEAAAAGGFTEMSIFPLDVKTFVAGGLSLEKAWDIVRLAGAPNGGLTFDTWHYFRGNVNEALLRTIPGERIFQVQFADAMWALKGTLVEDLLHHRLFPGKASFRCGK